MKHLALAAAALLGALAAPQAQAPVTGRVVSDATGEPIVNARVVLDSPVPDERVLVLTDPQGRFALPVPPGRHAVVAVKPGFARERLVVDAGAAGVELRLRRGAAISGRLVNELGEPVVGAQVAVQAQEAGSWPGSTTTDDRGEYRVGGLAAGSFVLAVSANPSQVKTFYPNAPTADAAESIGVDWGEERAGVDLVLPLTRAGASPFDVRRAPPVSRVPPRGTRPPAVKPAPPTAVVRGRIVDGEGVPVPYAAVRLDLSGDAAYRIVWMKATRTDADGRFEVADVFDGPHTLSASKVGYFNAERALEVKAGGSGEVVMTLDAWGAVGGRVVDEHGDPVQGARVGVLQIRYENGRRRLSPALALGGTTDDLGAYRLFALRPGQYVVAADAGGPRWDSLPGYASTFYPGTDAAAAAQFVDVGPAGASGIDFPLVRARTARVTGRRVDANNDPAGGSLTLTPSERSLAPVTLEMGARIFADGRFEFLNVPPGDYVIKARQGARGSSTESEFGAVRVTVAGGDVHGVIVRTLPGSSIGGRVVFDAGRGSPLPAPGAVRITAVPADFDLSPPNDFATADAAAGGAFRLAGISGPRRLEVAAPPGWMLKEIRAGGIDVTDRALPFGTADESLRDVEVILTDRVTQVNGAVRDRLGRPVPNAHVLVFAADRSSWYPRSRYLRRGRAGADGTFSVPGMPPASYHVAAVPDLPDEGEDAWQEPAYLDALLPAAATALVGDGDTVTVQVRGSSP